MKSGTGIMTDGMRQSKAFCIPPLASAAALQGAVDVLERAGA
ncbi:hypothetical protein [Thauera sp. 63]|nr:hypothetical protein [Thauera sp. 63]